MKASALIKNLQALIDEHGDKEVGVWQYEEFTPCKAFSWKDYYDNGTFFGEGMGFKNRFLIDAED
ncbi:hypothetical protein D3C81_2076020 [compost metagenome]